MKLLNVFILIVGGLLFEDWSAVRAAWNISKISSVVVFAVIYAVGIAVALLFCIALAQFRS